MCVGGRHSGRVSVSCLACIVTCMLDIAQSPYDTVAEQCDVICMVTTQWRANVYSLQVCVCACVCVCVCVCACVHVSVCARARVPQFPLDREVRQSLSVQSLGNSMCAHTKHPIALRPIQEVDYISTHKHQIKGPHV